MAYDNPNYTQTPNAFFDQHLPEIKSLAELKLTLIVMRGTLGWHEEEVDLTIVAIMKIGGMARQTVLDGISLALERGTIRRRKSGRSFTYEANILSVQKVDRSNRPDGLESRPLSVKNLDRSPDESLLVKESSKEKEKREGADAPTPGRSKKQKSQPYPSRNTWPHYVALYHEITGLAPLQTVWPIIQQRLGATPERIRLGDCYLAWVSRGYNARAITWLDWYRDGIPTQGGKGKSAPPQTEGPRKSQLRQTINTDEDQGN